MHWFSVVVQVVLAALTLGGVAYYCAALLAARQYDRERRAWRAPNPPAAMGVSILKPLRGYDPGMYEAFRSHCLQQYAGEYELLFGVATLDDPAATAVARLMEEFPAMPIRLLECPQNLGANGKVSTLAQLAPHARHDFLLVNDSDIFAPPLYLQHVMDRFLDVQVGMVTALYRGRTVPDHHGRTTVWSKFEALTVSTEFLGGVLLAKRIEKKIEFALGATLAIRRGVLEKIGGFAAIADRLADDYELGVRTVAAGSRVALTNDVVATAVPAYRWSGYLSHQIRWLRTVRDARPGGYFGIVFTFGTVWGLLAILASAGDPWALALFSLTLLARYALAFAVGLGIAGDRQVVRDWWLIVPRDVVTACLWLAAYAGNEIEWRGLRFTLRKGTLIPVEPS